MSKKSRRDLRQARLSGNCSMTHTRTGCVLFRHDLLQGYIFLWNELVPRKHARKAFLLLILILILIPILILFEVCVFFSFFVFVG